MTSGLARFTRDSTGPMLLGNTILLCCGGPGPVTGEVMLLDLNFPEHRNDEWDTIEGIELQTCSARLLAARLSLLDPPAYFNPPCVEWPKAHMAFFVFEDVPRTICWYKA